jgi:hypothetical protein
MTKQEILHLATEKLGTDSALAKIAGVHRSQPKRWRNGTKIKSNHAVNIVNYITDDETLHYKYLCELIK